MTLNEIHENIKIHHPVRIYENYAQKIRQVKVTKLALPPNSTSPTGTSPNWPSPRAKIPQLPVHWKMRLIMVIDQRLWPSFKLCFTLCRSAKLLNKMVLTIRKHGEHLFNIISILLPQLISGALTVDNYENNRSSRFHICCFNRNDVKK